MNHTAEQLLFINHPSESFVQACPGAGKTTAILARAANISQALSPRRGLALLSFTNSAVEEFKSRNATRSIPANFRYPSFLGTFDSFVRQFLFTPFGVPGSTRKSHIVESWKQLGIEVRLSGTSAFRGEGLGLDFINTSTDEVRTGDIKNAALRAHVIQNELAYVREAKRRRGVLNSKGYYTVDQIRTITQQRIARNDGWSESVRKAISARFVEVIVDEAQDCNSTDFDLLTWLRAGGIGVTMVCDPDQSIYGFRDGSRDALDAFRQTYVPANRVEISGNFRCSPAICAVAASLREEAKIDHSLGPSSTTTHRVVLIPYAGRMPHNGIGEAFTRHALELKISAEDRVVLAHSNSHARAASGGSSVSSPGTSKIERLAIAVGNFWRNEATGGERQRSVAAIERLIVEVMGFDISTEPLEAAIQRCGLTERALRRLALQVVNACSGSCKDTEDEREKWIEHARSTFDALGLSLPVGQTVKKQLRRPSKPAWSKHLTVSSVGSDSAQYSTVHQVKGKEFDAVCVVIPPDREGQTSNLLRAWRDRTSHEPKRVLYVAVTRAKSLVAIAVPESVLQELISILETANVPHAIQD